MVWTRTETRTIQTTTDDDDKDDEEKEMDWFLTLPGERDLDKSRRETEYAVRERIDKDYSSVNRSERQHGRGRSTT